MCNDICSKQNDTFNELNDLLNSINDNNIIKADTLLNTMNQLLFKQKEKLVIEMHGSKFMPRTITKHGKRETIFRTKHNGRAIQSNNYHTFIDKVAEAYGIPDNNKTSNSLTVDDVFALALDEKKKTENNSENTLDKLKHDYLRYLSQDFTNRQIRSITEIEIKEYTQTLTRKTTLKKKAFYAYKGVLNLIFSYALYHKIIECNPVSAIKNSVYLKNCDNTKPKNIEKILSSDEIETIKNECDVRMQQKRYHGYCVYAYVVKLAIETGIRVGELCALKEEDIHKEYIHIHAQ